jgi:hypothetical protein
MIESNVLSFFPFWAFGLWDYELHAVLGSALLSEIAHPVLVQYNSDDQISKIVGMM